MPNYRSYSQINQLRTCGEQFRLQRLEKVPNRTSCAAVAGTIFHSASERIDKHFHFDALASRAVLIQVGMEAITEVYDQEIEDASKDFPPSEWKRYGRRTKEKPNAEDMDWFLAVGLPHMVDAYVDWRLAHPWTLAEIPNFGPAIEVPFNYYLNGQLIHGFIDRVFLSDDGLPFPVDLKSGQKPKTDEQLGLYGAALREGLGWECPWGYFVYALKTGEAKMTPPLRIDHWTKEKLGLVYRPATIQIESQIFTPHPGEACFHCGVADHCQFAQAVV